MIQRDIRPRLDDFLLTGGLSAVAYSQFVLRPNILSRGQHNPICIQDTQNKTRAPLGPLLYFARPERLDGSYAASSPLRGSACRPTALASGRTPDHLNRCIVTSRCDRLKKYWVRSGVSGLPQSYRE